ncbi:MAG TPA: FG-GAP-like repeat-containing protein [Pyrinomonadaceae bacterium]|nr:FG-GAP-like repeat-containing protein [Pyrinomonadaceae bacterium]
MKRLLFLVTVVACLASSSAAPSASSATCGAASFNAALAFKVGTGCCGGSLQAVAVGDLNKDGRPDVITANGFSNTISVLLGGGESFSPPPVNLPAGGVTPFSVAVGDFNKDGNEDVVSANITSETLSIFLGDGLGGLAAATQVSVGTDPAYVVIADFNGDGNPDLASASSDGSSVSVLIGDGTGGFGPFSTFAVGNGPRSLVAADFNLDGKTDLAAMNRGSGTVSVLPGDGAGGFAARLDSAAGSGSEFAAAADFNGDGRLDLAVTAFSPLRVTILNGVGDGRFVAAANLPLPSSGNSIVAGDFDNDGDADIAAGTLMGGVSVRLGDGAGGFGAARSVVTGVGALYLAVTDFNLDGSDDLIVAGTQSNTVVPFAGDGAGNFAATPSHPTGTRNVVSTALADFDGDGALDAVMANENVNSVSVRLGTGTGSFGDASDFAAGQRPFWVSVGDFNEDSKPDLVTANFLGGLSVLLGDGAGGFAAPSAVSLGSPPFNPMFVAVSDVNADGRDDLLAIRLGVHAVTVLLGNGAGGFGSPVNFNTAPNPQELAVGDFNNDGKVDLAVSDNSFSILLGDGAGNFAAPLNTNFGDNTGPGAIVAADFNSDGKLDFALANEFTNEVSVLIGDGTAHFAPRVNTQVGIRPTSLAVADFNGDGVQDIATGNNTGGSVTVLIGNGAGGFGSPTTWAVPTSPNSIAVGDLDGDGRVDLTAAGSGALAVLLNTCGDALAPPAARLSVDDVTVTETDAGTVNAIFNVTLAAASAQEVTVKFVTRALSAERGEDFQPVSGTLTFAPGVTSQTTTVPVVGDATDEFDEGFTLNLFEPVNALIADRTGAGTINDNDLEPSLSIGNVTAPEGQVNNPFGLTVTLSQASGKSVSVGFATADGTATSVFDYQSASGTLTIPAGTTSGVINVLVVGDSSNEPDETFFVNLSNPSNASVAAAQGIATIVNDDTTRVQFDAATFAAAEGAGGAVTVNVTRTGDLSGETFVSYATGDITASERRDYTAALGRLRFASGQSLASFQVVIADDRFDDDGESFSLTLSDPSGAELGAQATATVQITDNDAADGPSPVKEASFDSEFFVRQHYADFLNREPDAGGLAFWVNGIESCGADSQCRALKRVDTSAAFFLSIEFQETGFLVHRMYKAAYGDATGQATQNGVPIQIPVPVVRLHEFLPDTQRIGKDVIVGTAGWPERLDANKTAFAQEFVARSRFTTAFPSSMTPEQFVDALNANAGGVLSDTERANLVAELTANNTSAGRASVLRKVAEDSDLASMETNKAFVLMQFFGYLRRNPNDLPDTNYGGYNFWLGKLNEFGGDFRQAQMVFAFIDSIEYRQRFAP